MWSFFASFSIKSCVGNKGGMEMGNAEKLVGASFTLSPMCDDFVGVILDTLEKTDTSKVWIETDDVSTVVRGKLVHVFDVTKAICVYAARTGKHVSFQVKYTTGCPGNEETNAYLKQDDVPGNTMSKADKTLYAAAKFSLYPIGATEFMETIMEQVERMKEYVSVTRVPYATKLEGGLVEMFEGLEKVFRATVDTGSHHNVMMLSVSMNSPSHKID